MRIYNRRSSLSGILTCFFVFTGVFTFSQDQSTFSLEEAEQHAVNHSLKVKNAALDYEIARKKVWETTAIGLPQVNAQGSFQNLIHIPTQVVDASLFNPMAPEGEVMEFQMGQKYTTSLEFNVSQLIFDGSYIIGLQFSKFYQEMSETAMNLTKQEVKEQTREAYYNVLVAQENVKLMDSIILATENIYNQTKVYLENGMIEQEQLDQLELSLNRVKSSKQDGERQLEIALNMLKLRMGIELDRQIEVTETLQDILGEAKAEVINKEGNVQNNANYVRMQQQVESDTYAVKNEKMDYLPSLSAFLTHSQNAYRNEFNFFDDRPWYPTSIWGVSLQIPITSSGMKVSQVKQAELKLEKDNNSLEDLENSLEFRELQLNASMQSALEEMELEAKNVELAKRIYKNALKRKDIGSVSALTVTQLQQQLLTAEGKYIAAVMKLLQLKIQKDKLYNK